MKKLIAFLLYFSPVLGGIATWNWFQWPGAAAAAAGCCLLIYAGIRAGLLPLVEKTSLKGANGKNRPLYVQIDTTADYWRAVLAQEIWESIRKTNPYHLVRSRSDDGQRELELVGHEIEVQAAVMLYDVDEREYRKAEAGRMRAGYGGIFKGRDVEASMVKHTPLAREWVRKNRSRFA